MFLKLNQYLAAKDKKKEKHWGVFRNWTVFLHINAAGSLGIFWPILRAHKSPSEVCSFWSSSFVCLWVLKGVLDKNTYSLPQDIAAQVKVSLSEMFSEMFWKWQKFISIHTNHNNEVGGRGKKGCNCIVRFVLEFWIKEWPCSSLREMQDSSCFSFLYSHEDNYHIFFQHLGQITNGSGIWWKNINTLFHLKQLGL